MRKHTSLLLFVCSSLAVAHTVFANTIDNDTIKRIHGQLQQTFMVKCQYDVEGATNAACLCLADKAQMLLDDAALSQCSNDESGTGCITNLVSTATNAALVKDNIAVCMQDSGAKTPLAKPTNTSTPTVEPSGMVPYPEEEQQFNTATADQPMYDSIVLNNEEGVNS